MYGSFKLLCTPFMRADPGQYNVINIILKDEFQTPSARGLARKKIPNTKNEEGIPRAKH